VKAEFKPTHEIDFGDTVIQVQATGKGRAVDMVGFEYSLFVPGVTRIKESVDQFHDGVSNLTQERSLGVGPIGVSAESAVETIPATFVWVEVGLIRWLVEVCELAIGGEVLSKDAVIVCRDELRKAIGESKGGELCANRV